MDSVLFARNRVFYSALCLAILLLITISICIFGFSGLLEPIVAFADGDPVVYTLNDEHTAATVSAESLTSSSVVVVPSTYTDATYGTVPVTTISGFENKTFATLDLSGASNLTTIVDGCFSSTNCNVIFPTDETGISYLNVASIGASAFLGFRFTGTLTELNFPEVTTVGANAFQNVAGFALTTVSFPAATTLGDYAFACDASASGGFAEINLTSTELKTIPDYCFYNAPIIESDYYVSFRNNTTIAVNFADSLDDVETNSIESIGSYAFYGRGGLCQAYVFDSVETLSPYCFGYCGITSISLLSDKLTVIPDGCFRSCYSNRLITLHTNDDGEYDKLTYIGEYAFECPYFEGWSGSLVFPFVESIGQYAFSGNKSITSIYLENENLTSIPSNCFAACTALASISFHTDANGNFDTITSIGDWAFSQAPLRSQSLSFTAVTSIGEYAFFSCLISNLSLTNPGLTAIPKGCLRDCEYLTSLNLCTNESGAFFTITSIGDYAFYLTLRLSQSLSFPAVTSVGERAFMGNMAPSIALTSENLTSIPAHCFSFDYRYSNFGGDTQKSPLQSVLFYANEAGDFPNIVSIGEYAFCKTNSLYQSMSFPGVTSVGDGAFCGSVMPSIALTNQNFTIIPDFCFSFNNSYSSTSTALQSVSFYTNDAGEFSSIVSIGSMAFSCTKFLTNSMSFPAVTNLGTYAFESGRIVGLSFTSPELTEIPDYCFSNCIMLETFVLHSNDEGEFDKLTAIGSYAFDGTPQLTQSMTFSSVTTIGESSFGSSMECVTLSSENFTSIPSKAFYISRPHSLVFHTNENGEFDSIVSIGEYACYETLSGSVSFPAVTSIGASGFSGCKATSISLTNEGLTVIPNNTERM